MAAVATRFGHNGGVDRRRSGSNLSSSLCFIGALGFAASVLVVVGGTLAGAADPGGPGRLWAVPAVPVRPSVDLLPALVVYFGGLIILVRAWLLLRREHLIRPGGVPLLVVVGLIVVWSIPMLVGPPLGSRDVYAYAAQGRLADQGYDVYDDGPGELGEGDPVLAPVDPLYWESPVLYGPVFVALSSAVAEVTGDHVVAAVFGFRVLAVLGLVVTAMAVFDLSRGLGRDPTDALILAIANPLVLFHLVSGAHNEAIMLAFLVGGVAIGRRRGHLVHLGIALCAFAAVIKIPALLAVPFIGWHWAAEADGRVRRWARVAFAGLEAIVVMTLAGRLTGWGWGWVEAMADSRPVDAYLSITRVFGGGLSLVTGLDGDLVVGSARLLGLVAALAVTAVLLLRDRQSWPTALAWSLLLWAVLHPTTQPWYLTWGLMLLAASTAGARNRGLVTVCAAAMFAVLPIGPQLGLVLLDDASSTRLAIAFMALAMLTVSPRTQGAGRFRSDLRSDTVSVIVPTRHEQPNIEPFVRELIAATGADPTLAGRRLEILYVDDSDDDTPETIRRVARAVADGDIAVGFERGPVEVTMLHRRRADRWGGLGGAVVDGFGWASGTVAVVMDGDLQHPAGDVGRLVGCIDETTSLAVASRRIPGGSDGKGLTPTRWVLSRAAARLARAMFPRRVGRVADPLSGFFAVDLASIDLGRLCPDGFKILIELLSTHPEARVAEIPFRFAGRLQGMSKATANEGTRFLGHLFDVRIRTTRFWAGASLTPKMVGRSGRAIASS